MRKLLLCPPDFYGIEYEINPWMDRAHKALPELTRAQWQGLRAELQELGSAVQLIEPQPKLPDMAFTANAGLLADQTVILSNFRFPQRQATPPFHDPWFPTHHSELILP